MGIVMICEEVVKMDEPSSEVGLSRTGEEPKVTGFVINK